jgi:hypothetical protein
MQHYLKGVSVSGDDDECTFEAVHIFGGLVGPLLDGLGGVGLGYKLVDLAGQLALG